MCNCSKGVRFLSPKAPDAAIQPVPSPYDPSNPPPVQPGKPDPRTLPPVAAAPVWPLGIDLSMQVHLSTSPTGDVFSHKWTKAWRESEDQGLPHFVWENITFGDWNDKRVVNFNVTLPLVRQRLNLVMYLHSQLKLFLAVGTAQWLIMGRHLSFERRR